MAGKEHDKTIVSTYNLLQYCEAFSNIYLLFNMFCLEIATFISRSCDLDFYLEMFSYANEAGQADDGMATRKLRHKVSYLVICHARHLFGFPPVIWGKVL